METIHDIGKSARRAAYFLAKASSDEKKLVLLQAASNLEEKIEEIVEANRKDMEQARKRDIAGALLDRLRLDAERIRSMAEGMRQVAGLHDPVGEIPGMTRRPNGLMIGKRRVPFGVVGIIYEARPNVTADAFALCLKTGNASILRGGKEAIHSNKALVDLFQGTLNSLGFPPEAIQLVMDTSRGSAVEMMKARGIIDLLIPRGGAGLIRTVVENSRVPVIETGAGNCHIYVDRDADREMAVHIVVNAKTQRPGVCNAAESLLVHRDIAAFFLPEVAEQLKRRNVEIRGDETVCSLKGNAVPATEKDWGSEYLDLIISVKVVPDLDSAIGHIHRYGTGHSETIVTNHYASAQKFLEEVDAAAVYVNASTRFTDGFEFGFGAEIGISTQKLHARGPMGLEALTSAKYIIYGNGQVRE
ncbi:MAG: glutamate-5-semialdehyde dehydrogenase [Bacteroidales bacterium]